MTEPALPQALENYFARSVEEYKKPCFDSSMFIAKFNEEICGRVKRNVVFDWIWNEAASGKFDILVSPITLAEVHKIGRREVSCGDNKLKTAKYDAFFELLDQKFVKFIEIDERTGEAAHELCRSMDVNPNDSLILASALKHGCDVVLAWDVPLVKKTHNGIRIEEPFIYDRGLFYKYHELATEEEQAEYDRLREEEKLEREKQSAKPIETELRGGNGGNTASETGNGKAEVTHEAETPIKSAKEEIEDALKIKRPA